MFTTIEQTKEYTGKDVTQETIIMAQSIIEAYIGRIEVNVSDPNDRDLLGKAVAYQSAYMHGDEAKVFEQMGAMQIMQFGQMLTFDTKGAAPFIAPLAVLTCRGLSWHRIRSIKTGKILSNGPVRESGWKYE